MATRIRPHTMNEVLRAFGEDLKSVADETAATREAGDTTHE